MSHLANPVWNWGDKRKTALNILSKSEICMYVYYLSEQFKICNLPVNTLTLCLWKLLSCSSYHSNGVKNSLERCVCVRLLHSACWCFKTVHAVITRGGCLKFQYSNCMCVRVCVCLCLRIFTKQSLRVYVYARLLNQYLWSWIYSGTFPSALNI